MNKIEREGIQRDRDEGWVLEQEESHSPSIKKDGSIIEAMPLLLRTRRDAGGGDIERGKMGRGM